MIRTQIQLTEEQFEALKKISLMENVSMAELIRRGVNEILASYKNVNDEEKIKRALAAAGRFSSGIRDLSRNHNSYIAEAITD